MKQTNLLKTLLLLCALIVGSMNGWADDDPNWSYTVVNGDASKLNTTAKTFTVDATHVWSYEGTTVAAGTNPSITIGSYSSTYGIKFGESSSKYYKPVILSTSAFSDKAITKVRLYLKHNGKRVGNLTVKQGSTTIGTATTANTSDWISVVCSETNKGAGGTLEIRYEVDQAVYIDKIEVWYEDLGTATTTTIDASGITNTDVYLGTAAGSLSASVTAAGNPVAGATVSWSSSNEDVATIASDGTVTLKRKGSTTITASYAGDATYAASLAEYVLNVTNSAPQETDIIVATNYEWLGVEDKNSITAPTVINCEGVDVTVGQGDGNTAPRGDDTYIRLYAKNTMKFEAPANYLVKEIIFTEANSTWANSFDASVGSWDNTELKWTGLANEVTLTEQGSKGNNQFSQIEIKLVKYVTATVSDAGWATYVTPYNLEFAEGDAFVVSAATASTATLAPVTKIGANKAVLLKGEGVKTATVLNEAPAAVANELAISTGGEINGYVLAKKSGVVGFYKWAGGSLTSGKVYLPSPAGARECLEFSFDNETTGLSEELRMKNEESAAAWYDLQGRKVAQPTKGLYIVNGKKVVIK